MFDQIGTAPAANWDLVLLPLLLLLCLLPLWYVWAHG